MTRTAILLAALAGLALLAAAPGAGAQGSAHAQIQVSVAPDPDESPPGTTGTFTFTVKNIGSAAAYNIQIRITDIDDGIYVHGTQTTNLGGLGAGSTTTSSPFVYEVDQNATPGYYHVQFSLDYNYRSGNDTQWGSSALTGTIVVRQEGGLRVQGLTPDTLQAGSANETRLTLFNSANAPLSDVEGSWTNPGGTILPLGTGNQFHVASIASGAYHDIPLRLAVASSAEPGVYSLDLTLSYNDITGKRIQELLTLGVVVVDAVVDGRTSFEIIPADAQAAALSLNVANVGINTASSVTIQSLAGPGSETVTSSTFIGDIMPGDFSVATLNIRPTGGRATDAQPGPTGPTTEPEAPGMAGGAAGTAYLRISYTDTTGQRQTLETQVPFTPTSAAAATGFGPGNLQGPSNNDPSPLADYRLWVGAAAAAALVAWSVARRKKNKYDFSKPAMPANEHWTPQRQNAIGDTGLPLEGPAIETPVGEWTEVRKG